MKDWTCGRMFFQLEDRVEGYVLSHSASYGPAGAALVRETLALGEPAVMMLAKEQYALFRFLAGLLGCRRALDVGTFTGFSALAFAEGMGAHGKVITVDHSPAWIEIATKHWQAAGVAGRIEATIGEATEVLARMIEAGEAPFDIVFLDVDKARTQEYYERSLQLLSPRGLLIVDNTLWHGWVLDDERNDADTSGMRDFNDRVAHDARVEAVMMPIADGMTLVRRLG